MPCLHPLVQACLSSCPGAVRWRPPLVTGTAGQWRQGPGRGAPPLCRVGGCPCLGHPALLPASMALLGGHTPGEGLGGDGGQEPRKEQTEEDHGLSPHEVFRLVRYL